MGTNTSHRMIVTVYVGMMAAMIFVATFFFKFEIETPTGPVMIKTANILCLLAGMLFGGLYGGLAAGIGSMMFDLLNPKYVATAPFTLVFFFAMGFVCGTISHSCGAKGEKMTLNAVGATLGALSYFLLNAARNILTLTLAGSTFNAALIANSTKLVVSAINMPVGIIGALIVYQMVYGPLKSAGVLGKFKKN